MYTKGMLDERYNASLQGDKDKETYEWYVSIVGENRVLMNETGVTCYITDGEGDEHLTIEELEEKYNGFND